MRGRVHSNVEFLRILKSISGHDESTDTAFAKACGKPQQVMSPRLRGTFIPQKRFLKSALEHLMNWDVTPIHEVEALPEKKTDIPTSSGIYVLYDSGGQVLYIGKATNFRSEVWQTLGRKIPVGIRLGTPLKKRRPQLGDLVWYYSLYEIPNPRMRHNMEVLLLRVFANQTHNSNIGGFK